MGRRHTFDVKFTAPRFFDVIIDNFSFSSAWYQMLKVKPMRIVISKTNLLSRLIQTLNIKKIKLTIINSLVKLLQRLPMILNVKRIKFTIVWKELYKIIQSLPIKKIKFTVVFRQLLRVSTANISVKRIKFVVNMIVAQFRVLIYYDPYYLSDLDSNNLSDMDYIIAP